MKSILSVLYFCVTVSAQLQNWFEYNELEFAGSANDKFGESVAISGEVCAVSIPGQDMASIYELRDSTFSNIQDLTGGTGFGKALAMKFDILVVSDDSETHFYGLYFNNASNITNITAVKFETEAVSADALAVDEFGFVAIADTTSGNGVVQIFNASTDTNMTGQLLDDIQGETSGEEFGASVALEGFDLVVGAPNGNGGTGAVYSFQGNESGWNSADDITASDGAANDRFGVSVAVSGSRIAVGAPGDGSGTGKAYVYTKTFEPVIEETILVAEDPVSANGDLFGSSVDINGDTVVVGASGYNSGEGIVYVFARDPFTNVWAQAETLDFTGSNTGGAGSSLALDDEFTVVGAASDTTDGTDSGTAYVYVSDPDTFVPSQFPSLAPSIEPSPGPEFACLDFYKQCGNGNRFVMFRFDLDTFDCRTRCVRPRFTNFRFNRDWQCGSCLDLLT